MVESCDDPPEKGGHMSAVATNPEMLVAPRLSSNAPKVVSRPVSSIAHFRPARKMKKLLRSNSGTCTNTIKAVVCTQKAIRNGQISVDKNDGNFLCRKFAFFRPKSRQIEHAHKKSRREVLANLLPPYFEVARHVEIGFEARKSSPGFETGETRSSGPIMHIDGHI